MKHMLLPLPYACRRLKHWNGEELHIILGYLLLTKLCDAFCQEMGLTWLCVSISRMSCDNSNNVVAMSRIFEMLRRGSGAALHNLSCHTKIVWLTTLFFCWCCHHIFSSFFKISKNFGLFEGGRTQKVFGWKSVRGIIQQGPITLLLQTSVM